MVDLPNLKKIERISKNLFRFKSRNISIHDEITLPSKEDKSKTTKVSSSVIVGCYTLVFCAESKIMEYSYLSRYSEFV